MSVCIVDYGSGNLRSAAKAFERAIAESGSSANVSVTADAEEVAGADRVVLPGVGAFADCRAGLAAVDGMTEAVADAVINKGRPFLGICVGMQLMATRGLEHGETPGFGWIEGEVRAIQPSDKTIKIPHMGWNQLTFSKPRHPVLAGLEDADHAYFVHSYGFVSDDSNDVLARVDYGGEINAAVGRNNMIGTQFHPEKSQATGLKLITNFLNWAP
jgi:glutamine amidotransferase